MSKIVERVFQLTTPRGAELYGDIRWKKNGPEELDARRPVIIVCHGFKAFKDWGPFPAIGRFFAEAGFVSIVFNFSHNGIGKDFRKFTEQKKFSINSFKIELEDVETILEAITEEGLNCPAIKKSMIGIVGHSRGGGIAIIKAHEDRRIKAVAGWSTVAYFNRYTDGQRKRWREKGFVELPSINPLSIFRLSTALLDDLEQNKERLDITRAVERMHKPLLLIHGTADLPVPVAEAEKLYEISDRTMTEFISLEGVGHMYGARHPYKKESTAMTHVLELTSSWFHKHL
jgi:dipeptidyl aminopeptidase/acylaminoacyl peptidase